MALSSDGLRRWHVGELLDRVLVKVAAALEEVGDHRVGAADLDHARHFDDRADIRLLERALHDFEFGARAGRHAGRRAERAAALFFQALRLSKAHDSQLPANDGNGRIAGIFDRDRAFLIDRDAGVLVLKGDRAAVAQDLIALGSHQLALRADLERSVAGVALALRSLDDEKAVAVDGAVARVAGARE